MDMNLLKKAGYKAHFTRELFIQHILRTKSKETFFNPVYLFLFNTLFVYGIYQCKAELFLFQMIPHLQWLHVAELGYTSNNEAKSQINCAKITVVCEWSIGNAHYQTDQAF